MYNNPSRFEKFFHWEEEAKAYSEIRWRGANPEFSLPPPQFFAPKDGKSHFCKFSPRFPITRSFFQFLFF